MSFMARFRSRLSGFKQFFSPQFRMGFGGGFYPTPPASPLMHSAAKYNWQSTPHANVYQAMPRSNYSSASYQWPSAIHKSRYFINPYAGGSLYSLSSVESSLVPSTYVPSPMSSSDMHRWPSLASSSRSSTSSQGLRPSTYVPVENLKPSTYVPVEELRPSTYVPAEDLRPSTYVPAEDSGPNMPLRGPAAISPMKADANQKIYGPQRPNAEETLRPASLRDEASTHWAASTARSEDGDVSVQSSTVYYDHDVDYRDDRDFDDSKTQWGSTVMSDSGDDDESTPTLPLPEDIRVINSSMDEIPMTASVNESDDDFDTESDFVAVSVNLDADSISESISRDAFSLASLPDSIIPDALQHTGSLYDSEAASSDGNETTYSQMTVREKLLTYILDGVENGEHLKQTQTITESPYDSKAASSDSNETTYSQMTLREKLLTYILNGVNNEEHLKQTHTIKDGIFAQSADSVTINADRGTGQASPAVSLYGDFLPPSDAETEATEVRKPESERSFVGAPVSTGNTYADQNPGLLRPAQPLTAENLHRLHIIGSVDGMSSVSNSLKSASNNSVEQTSDAVMVHHNIEVSNAAQSETGPSFRLDIPYVTSETSSIFSVHTVPKSTSSLACTMWGRNGQDNQSLQSVSSNDMPKEGRKPKA